MSTAEQSITHIWERFNKKWLVSGAVSGLITGLLTVLIGLKLSTEHLGEPVHFLKIIGSMYVGTEGMAYGAYNEAFVLGLATHLVLSVIYGTVFAQLMHEESRPLSLVILGVVTSLIIWVFSYCLFMPAFNYQFFNMVGIKVGLIMHLIFGFLFGVTLSLVRKL